MAVDVMSDAVLAQELELSRLPRRSAYLGDLWLGKTNRWLERCHRPSARV